MSTFRLDEAGPQVRLHEANGPRRRLLLISPGWGSSGYYPPDVLERDASVISAGTHMYVDHPNDITIERPGERSIRDLAAVIETARWDANGPEGPGVYAEARVVPSFAPMIDELAEHIGVSIRGTGEGERGEAEGRSGRIITALTSVESVDFVSRAGRGGKVLELVESARTREALSANELRDAVWDALRERFADDDTHVYLQDFSTADGWAVFERFSSDEESYWRVSLTVDGDTVTVGDDEVEVERQVTYVAVDDMSEALQEARAALREARNVGQWFESHIHLDFTRTADEMAANGHLTRDERIALSTAIGDALDAFGTALEDAAPHLYDRDPFDDPPATPITTEEADVATIEELTARVSALESERDTAIEERDEARTELARRADADRVREANDAIATAVAAVDIPENLAAVAESLRERASAHVQVTRDADGAIVTDALTESARTAVQAEVDYLVGVTETRVTGLGEGATPPKPEDEELREANAERAAKVFAS